MWITPEENIIQELSFSELILDKIKENKILVISIIVTILWWWYKLAQENNIKLTPNKSINNQVLSQELSKTGDIVIRRVQDVIEIDSINLKELIKELQEKEKLKEKKIIEKVSESQWFAWFCKTNYYKLSLWASGLVGSNLEKKCWPTVLVPLIAYLSPEKDIENNIDKLNESSNRNGKNFTFFTSELVKQWLAIPVSYEQILNWNINPWTIITYLGTDDNDYWHVEIIIIDNNWKKVPFYWKIWNTIRGSRKSSPALKALELGNFQEFLKSTRWLSSAVCIKKNIDLNQFLSIFKSVFDWLDEVENLDLSLKEIAEINFNKNLKPELFAYNDEDKNIKWI